MNTHSSVIVFLGILIFSFIFSFEVEAKSSKLHRESLCKSAGYTCLQIKKKDSWESLWPDSNQRSLVMNLNRINTPLHRGMLIAVPLDLSGKTTLDFSPFVATIESSGEKTIVFDPVIHAFAAYDVNGQLVRWGAASGGSTWCSDIKKPCRTTPGVFRVFSKGGPSCISHTYPIPKGGAPMPYCMFFHGGDAFHGAPYNVPGYNASHGCVRLLVDDAKWLNQEFVETPSDLNNHQGTKVIIQPYPQKDANKK